MRVETATKPRPLAADARRAWLNLARLMVGLASLLAAAWVSVLLRPRVEPEAYARIMALLLGAGLAAFTLMMLWLGRDIARAWLAFGARLGFHPASRRPLHDLGTDRPALLGRAGAHCARLRHVAERRATGGEEWLQAELDLVGVDPAWWLRYDGTALRASDARLAIRAQPWLADLRALRLSQGRLVLRAPFLGLDETHARELLRRAAGLADELQKPL